MKFNSKNIGAKQKKLFYGLIAVFIGVGALLVSFTGDESGGEAKKNHQRPESSVDTVSQEIDPEALRISSVENMNERLQQRLESLEHSLRDASREKQIFEQQHKALANQAQDLQDKIRFLEEKKEALSLGPEKRKQPSMKGWERVGKKDERHVSFEIPAGTVLKAVLVSGADCSVAVSKPTGPNMMLLRPLDNGQLPRNVRVPLKGSVILGNAIGDISSERVYVRAERMTLVEKNGSFVETEVSAYVSGEDGREGMRGVVVDRSGKIVARAAFAAFLQGLGQGFQAVIQKNVIDKVTDKGSSVILTSDMLNPIQQGTGTALGKLTDYYIKRSEQLQPTIQIAAGRVVDVVFTKSVKIGEKDLKKKFDMQRAAKREEK